MDLGTGSYVGDGSYTFGIITNIWKVPVIIGNYTSIASNVNIIGGEHPIVANRKSVTSYPFNEQYHFTEFSASTSGNKITIGSDVWIGMNAALKNGITIGDGAVVGAFSVVTKDVAPYEIVGGNPAKHIRLRFAPEQIDELLNIKWWFWDLETIKQRIGYFNDVGEFIRQFGSSSSLAA